jgi:hypothetical protein
MRSTPEWLFLVGGGTVSLLHVVEAAKDASLPAQAVAFRSCVAPPYGQRDRLESKAIVRVLAHHGLWINESTGRLVGICNAI